MATENDNEFVFYSDKLNYKTVIDKKGKEFFIEGYISTGDIDLVNDIVTKSCMDSMFSQFDNRSIKLDFEHETFRGKSKLDAEANKTRLPLGRAVDRSIDSKGVKVKWKMNENWKKFDEKGNVVMDFKDIWNNVENEMLDAFSIAYVPTSTKSIEQEGKSVRLLDNVNLLNVALTGNPINPMASMSAVMAKSLEFMKSKEEDYDNVEIKDTELKYKYTKRTGSPGNYTYEYPDGSTSKDPNKKEPKKDSDLTHENAISIIKQLHNTKEDRQMNAMSELSDADLQYVRATAEANLFGSKYQKEASQEAIKVTSKELNERKKERDANDKKYTDATGKDPKKIADAGTAPDKATESDKKPSGPKESVQSSKVEKQLSKVYKTDYWDTVKLTINGEQQTVKDPKQAKKLVDAAVNAGYGDTVKLSINGEFQELKDSNKIIKKSADELFDRALELNLSVEMADKYIKSNLSDNNVDNNTGYKTMVDEKQPDAEAKPSETPVETEKVAEAPEDTVEAKPEGKSMSLTELKSIVEVLTKDIEDLKKENADLKAILEKPVQKSKGAENNETKSQQETPETKSDGPLDMIQ